MASFQQSICSCLLPAVLALVGSLAAPSVSAQGAAPVSEEDWQAALSAIREVALDKGESDEHRANAVMAYAKASLRRKQHGDALKLCQEVLTSADRAPVADAALRAGCLIERDRYGHLRAEMDFLASCPEGVARGRGAALSQELGRAVYHMSSLAGRKMVPAPVELRFPSWAGGTNALRVPLPEIRPPAWYRFQPGEPHPAFRITRPKMEPPEWYRRVIFQPLKERR